MAAKSALDVLKRILLSFRRNWGLKLVSLLFAIILWNYVIGSVNPVRSVTIPDVPVMVSADTLQQLSNSGLAINGDIKSIFKNVTVTLNISRSDVSLYGKSDIQVMANFSGVTHAGQMEIMLTATVPQPQKGKNAVTVVSTTPQSVKVNIDKREKRLVPVIPKLDGIPMQGYYIGEPEVNPSTLEISGPSANVKLVDRAEVHISLTNQTAAISSARDFTLFDANNKVLDANTLGLDSPSNCIVNLQILPIKRMTVDAKNSVNGNPAWGYEKAGDPVVEPSQVTIAGPQSTLDAMGDMLVLGKIDITGINAAKSETMTPELPSGVIFVGTSAVQVLVNIQPVMTTVTLKDVHVNIVGLASGLKVDKAYTVNATLTVPQIYASRIRRANFTVTADASGLGTGAQTLELVAAYSDPQASVQNDAIKLEPASISVTISTKATS